MTPYFRQPEYLSPSSFMLFERDPIKYYLAKMGPPQYAPEFEPSLAMKVGSMVDGMLGCLWEEKGCPKDWFDKEEYHRSKDMFFSYIALGGWERLQEIGIADVQRELWGVVPETDVPIHGFADVVTVGNVVVDWKCSGGGRADPPWPSPPRGYKSSRQILPNGDWRIKQHADFGIPMDQIKEDWATQLTVYNWILNEEIRPYTGIIHNIIAGGRFVEYEARLTMDFQYRLRERMVRAWQKIEACDVLPEGVTLELARLM